MNNITKIKEEKRILLLELKEVSVAKKKSFFFARHYSYLNKRGKQILMLISTFIIGIFISIKIPFGLFLPYIAWMVYDRNRMEELVKTYNDPIYNRIEEIDKQVEQHEKLRESMNHTIKFLEKFKKAI